MAVQVAEPMDLATMLAHVNAGRYPTAQPFAADLRAIAATATLRWGDDPSAVRDISDAHALVDEGMQGLAALPPDLVQHCEALQAKGGVDGQRPEDVALTMEAAAPKPGVNQQPRCRFGPDALQQPCLRNGMGVCCIHGWSLGDER